MSQKCEVNEHIVTRDSEEQGILCHFLLKCLCYITQVKFLKGDLYGETLPEGKNLPFSFILETSFLESV